MMQCLLIVFQSLSRPRSNERPRPPSLGAARTPMHRLNVRASLNTPLIYFLFLLSFCISSQRVARIVLCYPTVFISRVGVAFSCVLIESNVLPSSVLLYLDFPSDAVGPHRVSMTETFGKNAYIHKPFDHFHTHTNTRTNTHECTNFGQWTLSARMSDTLDRLQPFNELVITAIINQSIHQPLSRPGRLPRSQCIMNSP